MRRYDDLVVVDASADDLAARHVAEPHVAEPHVAEPHVAEPHRFIWRGRPYVIGSILAHWVEVGAWWRQRDAEGLPVDAAGAAAGRQVWRVEARTGVQRAVGVFDLTCDQSTVPSTWRLARVLD